MGRFHDLTIARLEIIAVEDGGPEQRTLEQWEPVLSEARDYVLANVDGLAPDIVAFSNRSVRLGRKRKLREALHNERSHLKKLGQGFRKFDDAVLLAQSVNRALFLDLGHWLSENKGAWGGASVIGFPEILGGSPLRTLTLLGMHARACTMASEISLLGRRGFVEGAHSRARSLYELSTLLTFLVIKDSDPPFELTEKYSLSAFIEARKESLETGDDDPFDEIPGLEQAIRDRWGPIFFKPHGWAASSIGNGTAKQVTFRDIEAEVGLEYMRHAYLTMNHSVHAGPIATVKKFDDRKPSRFVTDNSVDYAGCAWIMGASAQFLNRAHRSTAASLAPLVDSDLDLTVGLMENICHGAESEFVGFV